MSNVVSRACSIAVIRVVAFPARADGESYESQSVTLIIDSRLGQHLRGHGNNQPRHPHARRIERIYRRPNTIISRNLKASCSVIMKRQSRTQYFLREHSVTHELVFSLSQEDIDNADQAKRPERYAFCTSEPASRPKWISWSPMTTVVADFAQLWPDRVGIQHHRSREWCDAWEAWKRRAPPAGHLRLDDAGYRRVGALPMNSRRGSRGLAHIILITARAGKANYLDAMDSGDDDFL
jgi:hypothetical protein